MGGFSLAMPQMKNATGSFSVRSYVPLNISLPFEEADDVALSGNISRYALSKTLFFLCFFSSLMSHTAFNSRT